MRRTAIVVLGLVLGASAAVPPAQAARASCSEQPGTTLRSNSQARVYETEPDASEDGTLTRLWACRADSRSRELLFDAYEDPFGDEQSYESVRLAGLRAAVLVSSTPFEETTTYEVFRYDLGSDRLDRAPATRRVGLVMSRAGGVAWIESGAVRALATPGARTLDAGPVQRGSLRAAGRDSVSWVRDGRRRVARVR